MNIPPLGRRQFLGTAAGLGALLLCRPQSAFAAKEMPKYKISLAEWSLHKSIFGKQIDHLDFAKVAKEEFGIEADVVEVAQGPTVTRYEIRLGPGIKVQKIVSLADNLAERCIIGISREQALYIERPACEAERALREHFPPCWRPPSRGS